MALPQFETLNCASAWLHNCMFTKTILLCKIFLQATLSAARGEEKEYYASVYMLSERLKVSHAATFSQKIM